MKERVCKSVYLSYSNYTVVVPAVGFYVGFLLRKLPLKKKVP